MEFINEKGFLNIFLAQASNTNPSPALDLPSFALTLISQRMKRKLQKTIL